MPAKKHRVNRFWAEKIFKDKKRFVAVCAIFYYTKTEDEYCKFSVVVPKKVEKKAVARNKLKRRTREIIKELIKRKHINKIAFLVLLKQNCKYDKFDDLKSLIIKDMESFLTKIQNIS